MREILFRGKSIETGKWIEPNFNSGKGACYVNEGYNSLGGMDYRHGFVDVDPETVGEFSGKKDIHEIKIFEGDIIKGDDDITPNRLVTFSNEALGFFAGEGEGEFIERPLYDVLFPEVIGNIYDKGDN